MLKKKSERISINGKILQYGVVCSKDGKEYQIYTYPGMTVAEIAFNMMVTIRLLEKEGYIANKDEVLNLVNKYYTDPQYLPCEEVKE